MIVRGLTVLTLLIGCSGDISATGGGSPDAQEETADSGAVELDAAPWIDAAIIDEDAAEPAADASPPSDSPTVPARDAAPPDATPSAPDAAPPAPDASPYPMAGPGETCDLIWQNCYGFPHDYRCVGSMDTRVGWCEPAGDKVFDERCVRGEPQECIGGLHCGNVAEGGYYCRPLCLEDEDCELGESCYRYSSGYAVGWCS